jgi:hypothetical protein
MRERTGELLEPMARAARMIEGYLATASSEEPTNPYKTLISVARLAKYPLHNAGFTGVFPDPKNLIVPGPQGNKVSRVVGGNQSLQTKNLNHQIKILSRLLIPG